MKKIFIPKITIITASLNHGRFIEQAVKSVLSQDYPHIEYIIIDGGSTDETVNVIKRYENRISYWVSEPDNGIADAFNKGLKAATGDYIQFLNSDDWLLGESVISRVVEVIKNNNYPLLLYGNVEMVDRDSGELLWKAGAEFSLKKFLSRMTIPHQGLFVKRDYFERYGYFDPSLRYSMDYELLLRASPHLNPLRLDCTVSRMREGGASRMNKAKTMIEAAGVQVRHGIHSPLYAYMLSLFFTVGMTFRGILEKIGVRISWRF